MKLTVSFIRSLRGGLKARKHSDGGGLYLYVTPAGGKLWRMGYRFLGRQKLLSLGSWPAVSLKEARARREAAKGLLAKHIDPSAAKREARLRAARAALNSFEAVAREWLEKYSPLWTPRHLEGIRRRLERDISSRPWAVRLCPASAHGSFWRFCAGLRPAPRPRRAGPGANAAAFSVTP